MNADLEALIRLQQTHDHIAELTSRIEHEIPDRIAELESSLREVRQQLDTEQLAIEAAQKNRAQIEFEMKTAEENLIKYKAALMKVKTNDEYRAALNEIDYTKRAHSDLETQALELMEATGSRRESLKTLETEFQEEDKKIHADRKVMEEERRDLIRLRQKEQAIAGEIESKIPGNILNLFKRIAGGRGGVALALARNGICACCNMRLRPSIFQQVKKMESILVCDNCKRILYYQEEEAEGEEPAGEASHGSGAASARATEAQPSPAASGQDPASDEAASRPETKVVHEKAGAHAPVHE
ncbi:MAG: zinc ribbon domain-containing protein [Acidobacteriota bacterium]